MEHPLGDDAVTPWHLLLNSSSHHHAHPTHQIPGSLLMSINFAQNLIMKFVKQYGYVCSLVLNSRPVYQCASFYFTL